MSAKLCYVATIGLLWITSFRQIAMETVQEVFLKYNNPCNVFEYRCENLECIDINLYCNGEKDCSDNSDEDSCYNYNCPGHAPFACSSGRTKCIPRAFICNGRNDCPNHRDEESCKENIKHHLSAKHFYRGAGLAQKWIHKFRKGGHTMRKWGADVSRIAVALYLSNDLKFYTDETIRYEVSNELSVGLLSRLALRNVDHITSTELASYINAFLVTCINPRRFYVVDLVKELRKRVDTQNHTLPYVMLAMCNAGEKMNDRDVERLKSFFSTAHRKHWTDMQALSLLALACVARQTEGDLDLLELEELSSQLKARQYSNGTYETLKTSALVIQALIAAGSEISEGTFRIEETMKQILLAQADDGSFGSIIDTYSILPTLAFKTLADIDSSHCSNSVMDEKEMIYDMENQIGAKWNIQLSVWIGNNRTVERTLSLRVPANISFERLMELEEKLGQFRFEFILLEGKPHIYSIYGIQNDAEKGMYWFLFMRSNATEEHLEFISPADLTPGNNQHLVFWYKFGSWNE